MNQFFSPLTEPLGAIWLLMALGVAWLLVRRQWRSALWLGIPTALIFLLGSTSIAEGLVAVEERPWVAGAEDRGQRTEDRGSAGFAPADAVVALGGGQRVSQHDVLGFAMEGGGSRVLTAIELVRLGKAKTLVLGGSWPLPGKAGVPSMSVVQDWVTSWGCILEPGGQGTNMPWATSPLAPLPQRWRREPEMDRSQASCAVTNLGICITTRDEAVAFKKLNQSQGWQKVILVTSALHLRRSEALFRKLGIEVIPVAADFQVWGVPQDSPFSPFPRQHRLFLLALYMHEKIGWWVYRARGWV